MKIQIANSNRSLGATNGHQKYPNLPQDLTITSRLGSETPIRLSISAIRTV